MSMEKIHSEERKGKQTRIPLSDDELEKVSGGNVPIITYNNEGQASADGSVSWDIGFTFIDNSGTPNTDNPTDFSFN